MQNNSKFCTVVISKVNATMKFESHILFENLHTTHFSLQKAVDRRLFL